MGKTGKLCYKKQKGTAGVNREKAAKNVVYAAMAGDPKAEKLVHYAVTFADVKKGEDFASYQNMLSDGKRLDGYRFSDEEWKEKYDPSNGKVTKKWVEAVCKISKSY